MTHDARLARNKQRLEECYPYFRLRLSALLADLTEAGYRPRIQDAWRSPESQLQKYLAGFSKLRFGLHNATSASGKKESLAAEVYHDPSPLAPTHRYLISLAHYAARHELMTGIEWGLTGRIRETLREAVKTLDLSYQGKLGWDCQHVQVRGISATRVFHGDRPS
jgi:hypothetical protein